MGETCREDMNAAGGNHDGRCDARETCQLAPELGFDAAGNPLFFHTFDPGSRVAVIHHAAGAPGIADDSFVIAFLATPDRGSGATPARLGAFSDQKGIWPLRVDVQRKLLAAADYVYRPTLPLPVAQIGDVIGGHTLTALAVYDPIARALTDNAGNPRAQRHGDHRIAFWAATTVGNMVVRATHLDNDITGLVRNGTSADGHNRRLQGAKVELYRAGMRVAGPIATDAKGIYHFENVGSETYRVRAWLADAERTPSLVEVRHTEAAVAAVWVEREVTVLEGGHQLTRDIAFSNDATAQVVDSNVPVANRDRLDDMATIFRFAHFAVDQSISLTGARLADTVVVRAYHAGGTRFCGKSIYPGTNNVCITPIPDGTYTRQIDRNVGTGVYLRPSDLNR
jgi:hypothetical protein